MANCVRQRSTALEPPIRGAGRRNSPDHRHCDNKQQITTKQSPHLAAGQCGENPARASAKQILAMQKRAGRNATMML
jgi:hypothetical protein